MELDISKISKVNMASLNVEFLEKIDDLSSLAGDFEFDEPISFIGTVINTGSAIELNGSIKAQYRAKCYRCLKEVVSEIFIDISERFIQSSESTDVEDYTYEGSCIDIEKVLKDNIILNLPMKQLCTVDCKGLCLKCGTNLNDKSCLCIEDSTDIKMEVLRNFFND